MRLAQVLCLAGALAAIVLVIFQDRLIFPAHLVPESLAVAPEGATPIAVSLADGTRLSGLSWVGGARLREAPLLLVFGGNAMNADDFGANIAGRFPDLEVIAVNYRGYGDSEGRAGTGSFVKDALAVYDSIPDVANRRVILVGASIGSAAASHVLAERPAAGAILVTPFDSLAAAIDDRVPLLGYALFRELAPADDVARAGKPVALIFAERDEILTAARGEALRAAARSAALSDGESGLVFEATIAEVGHNSIHFDPGYGTALQSAFDAIEMRRLP